MERLAAGIKPGFSAVDMIDLETGWGIGGDAANLEANHVFRTLDGGFNWIDVTPPEIVDPARTDSIVAKGAFWDSETAWVVYYENGHDIRPASLTVWGTTDGGAQWTAVGILDLDDWNSAVRISDVFFINAKTGWVFLHPEDENGADRIALFQTTDAGITWNLMVDPTIESEIQECEKTGILFTGPWDGWLTGDCHAEKPGVFLYQTFDGGKEWVEALLPNPPSPAGLLTSDAFACRIYPPVFFSHGSNLMMGVECTPADDGKLVALIYSSQLNAGGNWHAMAYPGGELAIRGAGDGRVFRTEVSSGLAVGEDVYMYSDAVGDWEKLSATAWRGPMDFVDWNRGWMAASDGESRQLMVTFNGGRTWEELPAKVSVGE
jgi:hypothetical protein